MLQALDSSSDLSYLLFQISLWFLDDSEVLPSTHLKLHRLNMEKAFISIMIIIKEDFKMSTVSNRSSLNTTALWKAIKTSIPSSCL